MIIRNLYFLLTPNCNLKCRYCFQEDDYHSRKNAVVTKAVIDDFLDFISRHEVHHVELFGGEPLYYKEPFLYVVKALRRHFPDTSLGMVTNGTLIDEEVMALLESLPISVLLSLDGRPERHDAFRGGFAQISRWFPRLTATGRVSIALQAGLVTGLYEQLRYLWDLGFRDVYINAIQNYGWYRPKDVEIFGVEYEQAVLGMLRGEGHLLCAGQLQVMLRSSTFDQRCGIADQGLTCDWRGRLFPCHRSLELGDHFTIGTIYTGLDQEFARNLRQRIWEEVHLSPSASRFPLVSFCPVNVYQKHGHFSGPWPEEFCRMIDQKLKVVAKYHYEIEEYLKVTEGPLHQFDNC